ncbi:MAG: hypothetical protein HQK58_17680 [Deltaproteobacteria bacterium]|nr:hypothetical protein [Deltaproteobacteria bacterium]
MEPNESTPTSDGSASPKRKDSFMDIIIVLLVVCGFYALNVYILPKLGIST